MSWRARPAVAADLDSLRAIYNAARSDRRSFASHVNLDAEEFKAVIRDEYLIAVEDQTSRIGGFAGVYVPGAFLHHLYVSPDRRRVGLGRLLLDEAIKICDRRLRLKCITANSTARAFYKALGWRESEDGGASPDGDWIWIEAP